MKKQNIPRSSVSLSISREAEIYAISKTHNMGMVNLLSMRKLWENTNTPKVWISYVFRTPLFCV